MTLMTVIILMITPVRNRFIKKIIIFTLTDNCVFVSENRQRKHIFMLNC